MRSLHARGVAVVAAVFRGRPVTTVWAECVCLYCDLRPARRVYWERSTAVTVASLTRRRWLGGDGRRHDGPLVPDVWRTISAGMGQNALHPTRTWCGVAFEETDCGGDSVQWKTQVSSVGPATRPCMLICLRFLSCRRTATVVERKAIAINSPCLVSEAVTRRQTLFWSLWQHHSFAAFPHCSIQRLKHLVERGQVRFRHVCTGNISGCSVQERV